MVFSFPEETVEQSVTNIMLPSHSSFTDPGRFVPTVPQRGIIRAIADQRLPVVTFMASSQVGKTLVMTLGLIHYTVYLPQSVFLMLPKGGDVQSWLTRYLEPIWQANADIRSVIKLDGRRKHRTEIAFVGGLVYLRAGTTESEYRGPTAGVVLMDEVDAYRPHGIDDPIAAAAERSAAVEGYTKLIAMSTPSYSTVSKISPHYDASDQSRFITPCYHCDHPFEFTIDNIYGDNIVDRNCGAVILPEERVEMIEAGSWEADEPVRSHEHRGFRLNRLQHPKSDQNRLIREFKHSRERLSWRASAMCIPLREEELRYEPPEDSEFEQEAVRAIPFDRLAGVYAGIDLQKNRWEWTVAWHSGAPILDGIVDEHDDVNFDRFHVVRHGVLPRTGDDTADFIKLLDEVDAYSPDAVGVDTGYQPSTVKHLIMTLADTTRWLPIKGYSGPSGSFEQDVVKRKMRDGTVTLPVDELKMVWMRLMADGRITIEPNSVPVDYVRGLLGERLVINYARGGVPSWVPRSGRRNEPFDNFVYILGLQRASRELGILLTDMILEREDTDGDN